MPIYVFKCPECGHEQEFIMQVGSKPPLCQFLDHCAEMEKVLTAPASVVMKAPRRLISETRHNGIRTTITGTDDKIFDN